MDLRFKQVSGDAVQIIEKDTERVIGNIFTPSGTGHDTPSSIQVCGFDRAFDLWGCGVFHDGKGIPKQDIQLLFNKNSTNETPAHRRFGSDFECFKCHGEKGKCQCDKLKIYSLKELIAEHICDMGFKGKII